MTTANPRGALAALTGRLGPLRSLLVLAVGIVVLAAPFADGSVHAHDWRLLPTVIAPTVMVMLLFAIPLDITMARIFMSDASSVERARLAFAIRVEMIALVVMVLAWIPFIHDVLDFTPLG